MLRSARPARQCVGDRIDDGEAWLRSSQFADAFDAQGIGLAGDGLIQFVEGAHAVSPRQAVVHVAHCGHDLSVTVVSHVLTECLPDTLGAPPSSWPRTIMGFTTHGLHVDRFVADDVYVAGFWVDFNLEAMTSLASLGRRPFWSST